VQKKWLPKKEKQQGVGIVFSWNKSIEIQKRKSCCKPKLYFFSAFFEFASIFLADKSNCFMKVFIVGASGLVGGNCLQHFSEKGWEVKGSYFSYPVEGTVFFNTLEPNHPNNFDIRSYHPDVIVHCGALTHVDYCEAHPEESYEKTVVSTQHLIAIANQCKAKLVYLSTDYVFDGVDGPYTEDAPVNPLSVYARHKLEAEQLVLKTVEHALVLRVTNVYGDEVRGKNFIARIIDQCKNNQKLTLKLPYDQYATPANAWDIARAMFVLLRDSKKGIYHICSTDFLNRVELALRVLQYFPNAEYDLYPISTDDMQQPAKRPLIGGFVKHKFSSEYPDFLFGTVDSYLAKTTGNKPQ
jgi:dTDP-4-dehydrorhamnose reductase